MGLESLVNSCLEPVERLAKKVYDVMPGLVQKGMDYVKKGYTSVKDILHKYVTRNVDKYVISPVNNYMYKPAKWTAGKTYDWTLKPAVGTFERHPLWTTVFLTYLLFLI